MEDPDSILRSIHFFLTKVSGKETLSYEAIFGSLAVIIILIIINGLFSASELSMVSLNDNKIKKRAEEGDKKAQKLVKLLENPSEFLATVQVGVTLAGFLSSAFAADKFSLPLALWIDPSGKFRFTQTLVLVILTALLSYFSLVFGELVPKRLAMRNPEKLAKKLLPMISFFHFWLRPVTHFLSLSTNFILRIFGIHINEAEDSVTEEEIRIMIDVGREKGSIHVSEKEMIENIFEFNDKEVSEIMTHRTAVTALRSDVDFSEVMNIFIQDKFSRVPVYEESLDNIIGILHIKDILTYSMQDPRPPFVIKDYLRAPYITPETKTIDSLFREMQKERVQMAVVIDEYGGTAGIITIEDLLEEIVGNIQDEYDEEVSHIQQEGEDTWLIDGLCEISELEKHFPKLSLVEEEDYETVAGLVIHSLDRIPEQDEHAVVQIKRAVFEVLEMEDKRISKLRMTLLPEEKTDSMEDLSFKNKDEVKEEDNQ